MLLPAISTIYTFLFSCSPSIMKKPVTKLSRLQTNLLLIRCHFASCRLSNILSLLSIYQLPCNGPYHNLINNINLIYLQYVRFDIFVTITYFVSRLGSCLNFSFTHLNKFISEVIVVNCTDWSRTWPNALCRPR